MNDMIDNVVIKYTPIPKIENACITDFVMAKGFFKSAIKIGSERRHYKLTYNMDCYRK